MKPELVPVLKGLYNCKACTARAEATSPVGSSGPALTNWIMVVGRNPGMNEDEQCKPFVGRSGAFLDNYLLECNLSRPEVYVTNALKCHTKGNREPDIFEIKECTRLWLHREIIYLQPRLIFILGADAFRGVFNYNISPWVQNTGVIRDVRNEFGFQAVILPHPSAVISHNPNLKIKYDDTVEGVKAIIKQMKEEG